MLKTPKKRKLWHFKNMFSFRKWLFPILKFPADASFLIRRCLWAPSVLSCLSITYHFHIKKRQVDIFWRGAKNNLGYCVILRKPFDPSAPECRGRAGSRGWDCWVLWMSGRRKITWSTGTSTWVSSSSWTSAAPLVSDLSAPALKMPSPAETNACEKHQNPMVTSCGWKLALQ